MQEIKELLQHVIFGIPLYKWALALTIFFLFIILRKVFSLTIAKTFEKIVSKTKTEVDDKILSIIISPLNFLFIIIGLWIALTILNIKADIVSHLIKSLFIFDIFWIFYNLVNVFSPEVYKFTEKFGKDLSKEIASLIIKLSKLFVIILGIVAILQEWGINVSTLIASLGIGGLAVALAAKDTLANFFGGLSILADKSMKIGDWVQIGDIEGIVEDIGIRSTKIRTFDKGLVTVPNNYIATNSVINFSRRNVRRVKMYIGVVYSTSSETLNKIVNDIRDLINNHPEVAKDQTIAIYFDRFGDSSLDIFIYFYTNTAQWLEYLRIKEDIQFKIMEIVEKNGSSFAFPSRSIYFENEATFKIKSEEK